MPDALVERDGHLMTITMNRPERYNALTGAMLISGLASAASAVLVGLPALRLRGLLLAVTT